MNKIKNIFLLLTIGVITIVSCDDNNLGFVNPFEGFDYEAQAVIDNDTLVTFLKTHYFDATLDSVKTLSAGKTSLFDETSKLTSMKVTQNDIEHTLYIYIQEQGVSNPVKSFPTVMDSVYVKYSGIALDGTTLRTSTFDSNERGIWFTLNSVIKGWTHGFTKLKSGTLKTAANGGPFNGPITYLNTGKAILFIPSGLAYPSSSLNNISSALVNTNLMFRVELLDIVEDTDHDNDGVPSIDEDANNDGDPTNDFSDVSNPNLPDYLNPDIK